MGRTSGRIWTYGPNTGPNTDRTSGRIGTHGSTISQTTGRTSGHWKRSQAGGRTMGPGPVVPMKAARQVVGPMVRFNADHEIATGSWIGPWVGPWAGQEVGDGPILGPWAGPGSPPWAAYGGIWSDQGSSLFFAF